MSDVDIYRRQLIVVMSDLHRDLSSGIGGTNSHNSMDHQHHHHGLSEQETRELLMEQGIPVDPHHDEHDEHMEQEDEALAVDGRGEDDNVDVDVMDDDGGMALANAAVEAATAVDASEQQQAVAAAATSHQQPPQGQDQFRKRSIDQVAAGSGQDGEEASNDLLEGAAAADQSGTDAALGGGPTPRKRGRPAAAGSSNANNNAAGGGQDDKRQAEDTTTNGGAGSSSGAFGGAATGDGGRELSEQERRARQREANRRAAERSRGKKNEELNNLERTVSKIQEENARLRAQLESLLNAAGASTAVQGAGAAEEGSNATPGAASHDIGASVGNQDPAVQATLGSAVMTTGNDHDDQSQYQQEPTTAATAAAPPHLALGADGLDLDTLGALATEIQSLKAQIAAKRAQIAASGSPGNASAHNDEDAAAVAERAALTALIDHLRESRDTADMERQVLEREIAERRAISKALSTRAQAQQAQAQTGQQHDGENGETTSADPNKDIVREIEEEIRKNRQGAGVERALIEVRTWIDEAIQGWKKVSPRSITLPASQRALTTYIRSGRPASFDRHRHSRPLPSINHRRVSRQGICPHTSTLNPYRIHRPCALYRKSLTSTSLPTTSRTPHMRSVRPARPPSSNINISIRRHLCQPIKITIRINISKPRVRHNTTLSRISREAKSTCI